MAYSIVVTENMSGTHDGSQLVSFKYQSSNTGADIENGHVVKLDGILSATGADREIFKAVDVLAATPIEDVVLVAGVEIDPDERNYALDTWINKAGTPTRGIRFHKGDTFSASSDAFTTSLSTVTAGKIVELAAGTKLAIVSSATASTTTIGVIHQVYSLAGKTMYSVLVK